jgi:hypothetical protein
MNDREFGNKIKQDLNYGLGRLEARVSDRLKLARERALEAFAAHAAPVNAYAFAGHAGQTAHTPLFSTRKWLPITMLMLALIGIVYWQQQVSNRDDDVDAALLSGDLPLNAYIDHDFHSWLDQSSQR